MNAQWRLFQAALRFVMTGPGSATEAIQPLTAARFMPLAGMVVGLLGGGIYWLGAEIWPTSVALILSLLAVALATGDIKQRDGVSLFTLLIKYNVLMALSAAHVPIALPEHVPLGLIMVAANAASRALVVSVMIAQTPAARMATLDLGIALVLGLAPATLLGLPGLVGLAAAIATRLVLTSLVLPKLPADSRRRLSTTQQFTEIGFYLGALAAWRYI